MGLGEAIWGLRDGNLRKRDIFIRTRDSKEEMILEFLRVAEG